MVGYLRAVLAAMAVVTLAAATLVAGLAPAQTAGETGGPFGGFKHDSSTPIEIVSDSLEVRQAEGIAIFAGTVKAGQGTLRLDADRVVVAFDPDETDQETGAIRNMRAEGNVFLSNGAETAQGDFAEYDVATGMMFLRGDVLLTQGGNAIAGNALQINLNTGQAEMTGGAPAASGTGGAGGNSGRVKTIFQPARGQGN